MLKEITNNPMLAFLMILVSAILIGFLSRVICLIIDRRRFIRKKKKQDRNDVRERVSWNNPFEHSKFNK